jgi:HK97 family phage major capsid protein
MTAIEVELQAIEQMSDPSGDEVQRSAVLADRGDVTDRLMAEFRALDEELKPLQEREDNRNAILARAQQVAASVVNLTEQGQAGGRNDHSVHVSRRVTDPFKDFDVSRARKLVYESQKDKGFMSMPSEDTGTDLVRRAAALVERFESPSFVDTHRERAMELLERTNRKQAPMVAAHILTTGTEEYERIFWDYIHDPMSNVQRTALSLTSANGGYLVPFTLDPTIILTNSGSANPFRQISDIKTTATNNWNGVASTGMNAAWLAEAGVVADASPTFSNIQITPQKASAWVFGSYEILEDSDFETELPTLLADAKDRLEEAAFATGSGTGQPKGVVTAATTVYTTASTSHTIAVADVYGIQGALPARFRRNAKWVASISAINAFRQLDTAGGSSYWTNLGQGQPERLLGGPIYESTSVHSYDQQSGSVCAVYGDFSQYAIVDRIGMSVMYEPMIKDFSTTRPTGQGGWFAFWRVGGDAKVPNAFRALKLA